MATNVVMPQLGESVIEGTVGKWLKQVGDKIEQYEPIMEVVTDKVTTEIPAPAAGTLLQIAVPEGATVNAGTVVAVIGQPGEQVGAVGPAAPSQKDEGTEATKESAPAPAASGRNEQPTKASTPVSQRVAESAATEGPKKGNGAATRLTPVVARMISEYGITDQELKTIHGSGEGGRISKKDLEQFVQNRNAAPKTAPAAEPELAPWETPGSGDLFGPTDELFGKSKSQVKQPTTKPQAPAAPPVQPGATEKQVTGEGEELVPLTPIRRSIAERMVRSKQIAPHVTTVHEADMTRVISHMKVHQDEFSKQGARLTYTPYLVQAAVHALRQVPLANAVFTDKGVLMRRNLNIGIAVAIEDGLIVPVIRSADEKSLIGLARAVNDVAARARDKKLSPEEVQGGTFTITNYGVFGSLFGTPIINQPQSAILGVGAIQKRTVVIDDAIAIRPMVYVALTFDHRLLDGATGDRFMTKFREYLESYPEA
ncbi:MAG: dihydrolipoamide acetyltransferase family protein [Rudaea sp.]